MMSRKVLIVPTGGLRREGITSSVLAAVRAMPRDGLELHIAAVYNNEPDVLDEFRALGCKVIETPNRRTETIVYMHFLSSLMRHELYDVIHVHGSSSVIAIELRLAQLAGVKVRIAHSHNTRSDNPKRDQMLRPLLRGSWTKAIACGVEAGKWLFGAKPFEVIHNGHDLAAFAFNAGKRSEMRSELGIGNALAIGFVGNINYVKNQTFLLHTFKHLIDGGMAAKLFIIGDGPDRSNIEELITTLALDDQAFVTGRVSNVPDYLHAMDFMMLPSLFEGLPSVVVEWQAAGLPCLVSDAVTRECATTDFVHFLPLSDGEETWANCLLCDIEHFPLTDVDRNERSRIAIARLYEEGFDIECASRRIAELYLEDSLSCRE